MKIKGAGNKMKILMLTGSAHRHGTSAALADAFIKGAEEAGHEVYRFDAALKKVHPCIACEKCHTGNDGCVFKDDMEEVIPRLLAADGVVLVSPIYYYNVSAQLKAVIDRFHAKGDEIHGPKKAAMLLTMEDDTQESAEGALTSFKGMTGYLGWKNVGTVAALACPNPEALQKTNYLTDAYNLGKSMRTNAK